ncbi:hypothetical protein BKP35_10365 [Anaerobacillus arseniciselenatis]|uniref:Uncharacterized protein n=1 Tax=Anaerobacillus arseniciselenatis TaxID=85682 RepID=A0A1S2LKP3_9BACI|nr:hypothetical protein [Anaerobacillus arseniciselenatis]OIJ12956.1 hypothetical protein BKP35_10365 [Anaerobacillus arseniciselenatis]
MFYYPYNWNHYYHYFGYPVENDRRLTDYYTFPHYKKFDPYKVELPKFHTVNDKSRHCHQQCLAAGFIPGTFAWNYCMQGCNALMGSLLDDPTFLEDMMEE